MIVFRPEVAEGYEWVQPRNRKDHETFLSLDGTPLASKWRPVEVRRVEADGAQYLRPSDFPWLGSHALVLRQSALEALDDLLAPYSEILPLATADEVTLFVVNVRTIGALDHDRSDVDRFPESGRIMRIKRPVFVEDMIRGVEIFRVPYRATPTYVSERFVERVESSGLKGLNFLDAWISGSASEL